MGKFQYSLDSAKNTVKAAAVASGFLPEGSYTSAQGKFPETTIGAIEQKNINYEGPLRNPVIVIHGFLGARLQNSTTKQNVWGEFLAQDVMAMSDERMCSLALPMRQGVDLNDLTDDTAPDGMLNAVKVKFYKYTYEQKAYENLIDVLREGGYQSDDTPVSDGKTYSTLFSFAYDWRRDIQWNAVRLHEFILEKKRYIQARYDELYGLREYDVKFNLMAHSMGGLVARYYLRFGTADLPMNGESPEITWNGAKNINSLFLLGTPNAGFVDTILELTKGLDIPPAPPALIGTWPTYYQMMPVPESNSVVYASDPTKSVDLFDVNVWKRMKWGLADPKEMPTLRTLLPDASDDAERREIALNHLEKCLTRAKSFINAMAIEATPPKTTSLFLVLGNAVRTTRRLILNEQDGSLKVLEHAPGDGKVTKASALFDKRDFDNWTPHFHGPIAWKNIILLRAAHMGITIAPAFKDNVLFFLSNLPQ